ncbi:bifunctional serine/threonine-protein kinase/ABC transporter substrate-binding protein [Streptomyces caniscabiei]|uniref:ABC transporter substrate-binding protein n=1 Tax=Streptomyces caniscabiei TaxID=2746961 RepID=A0A927QFT0_9ACTN|nr:bifunctional serine/threonine-protein kinase/ABC transporter substrate-binding protein [Streptomyces caniscabiei]MBD9723975.1 ABC transporter substrate-binding protein [Streptomyces caniscabiei]MDX3511369.1 bifunctional serine/threonine-protein kinase/ABC transporter substrate-binding protein [Streptomyces caniscabiei]MDX3718450.1 bifunctional serine/threonine-protein kinase/ABC transporter substrate-binding protein [Streptomyces caniscabiei]WEO22144.1 bifunctional serine/threonine-protein k
MEPLRTADPSRLGDYRLLRRLGAGGMGVVFLARAPGGAYAAVKVVRSSHADDAGFRARFRREIEVARQVDSPWVVPLLDADADAEDPWLATPFVPGPSLSETLEGHGPWSPASVAVLGLRLAEALDAVHRAGLVHRDVKPGNVLLAPDGPRLIDFGIARSPDGAALTSTGVIVGSPGFLSPEQARARGAGIGPPSDVFSLGCVLAFAATGVRPFGTGAAAGVLLRTVYDEPELPGVPEALEPVVRACLDKDPARRPTAVEVGAALDAAVPADRERWLPEPVTRLIVERSAAVLAMGAIEPTRVSAPASSSASAVVPASAALPGSSPDVVTVTSLGEPGRGARTQDRAQARATSRRGFLALGSTGAAGLLAVGGGAWWWRNRGERKPGAGGPPTSGPRADLVVAFQGDLSGATGEIGRAQLDGARLAVAHVNADDDRPLRLTLRAYDDKGEPDRTLDRATRLAKDDKVLAVLGPTTNACFLATEATYTKAVLPVVSVSVGVSSQVRNADASTFRSHAQLSPEEELLAAPCNVYLTGRADARKVFLVEDRAEGDFAWAFCNYIQRALGRDGRDTSLTSVAAGTFDHTALAARVVASGSDAVVFSGGQERAGAFAAALREAGFSGARVATQRAFGPRFLKRAGRAADGWVLATTFIDPTATPAARSFTEKYEARYGERPGRYAAEAYDAVLFLAEACTDGKSALRERGAIVRRMREVSYAGVSRTVAYTPDAGYNHDALFLYRVAEGKFDFLGQYQQAKV